MKKYPVLVLMVLFVFISTDIVKADTLITPDQTTFIKSGKNLFNKNAAIDGKYVNWDDGELWSNTQFAASDFISVESGQQYTINKFNRGMAFYDSSKLFIGGIEFPASTITTPIGCCYMRITPFSLSYNNDMDTLQVEKGASPTNYEAFYYRLDPGQNNETDEFKLFLPSEICVALGRTIELYNSQVSWCGNISNYHFQWDCNIGKAMERKFTVTGTPDLIGDYTLTLTVFDNNMNAVAHGETIIKVVSNTITAPKTVLTIGDSLTADRPWLGELRGLSGNQITLVGTLGTAPLQHEGRPGWSAGNYLTNTNSPFWDGSRFNWNYYKTATGISPNIVQIYLGTNGMELDPTINAGNIKQIIDYIRQDDPNIPIYVVNTLFRANQDGIGQEGVLSHGQWKLQEDRKVFNLMEKLNELLSGYSKVYFVPISTCHDSEYNFGTVPTPVNPRAGLTELLPVEGTHPQTQGFLQMADIMFSSFAAHQ